MEEGIGFNFNNKESNYSIYVLLFIKQEKNNFLKEYKLFNE
ncbi:hypothetical protein PL373_00455 [Tenacibaculum maritimum]|nr:hypothetical protein [Tenacibaculum maritimum]MDB0599641.1 hypothetical protein [Tenacibaculum maritimum]